LVNQIWSCPKAFVQIRVIRGENMTGDFYGLATRRISNQHLRLEFLAQAGPRIVRLMLEGSNDNLLAEVPDICWSTSYGDYYPRGGHRLWHAPEAIPRSSLPDNGGLTVEEHDDMVRLVQPVEPETHIVKSMEIRLHDDRPAVTVTHELHLLGDAQPVELAPWAITQLPLGGVAILPQRTGPADRDGVAPNRHVVLWPYTHWQDPRLRLDDDCILVEAKPEPTVFKVGYLNYHGWAGYWRAGVLFVKRFEPRVAQPHADLGCNVEVYCNDRFIELETLGPLSRIEPGQAVAHVERWELFLGDTWQILADVPSLLSQMRAA
jgi:hypothetical protein